MPLNRYPKAQAEARHLVEVHDGSAKQIVEAELRNRIEQADLEEALHLDQVRREIESIHRDEKK